MIPEKRSIAQPYSNLSLPVIVLVVAAVTIFAGYAVTLGNYNWLGFVLFSVFGILLLDLFGKHPSIGVFYILLSIPFGGIELLFLGKTPKIFFPSVLSLVLVTSVLLRLLSHRKVFPDKPVQDDFGKQQHLLIRLIFLYILLVGFSLVQLTELERPLYLVVTRCLVLVTFVLVLKFNQEPIHRIRVLQCVALVGASVAVLYLWNAALTYGTDIDVFVLGLAGKDNLARAGLLGVTNTIASFMAFTIPLTLALISLSGISRRQKLLASGGLVFQSAALIGSNSRGGIVSFLGGILLVLVFSFESWRLLGKGARLLAIVLVLGGAAFILTPQPIIGRYQSQFSPEMLEYQWIESPWARSQLLESAWRAFLEQPLTGIGIGNFGFYDLRYGTGAGSEAHNLFLQTLAEEGIFAFFVLISILLILGYRLFRLCRRSSALPQMWILAAFLAAVLNANLEPTFWHPPFSSLFWLCFAVLVSGPLSDWGPDRAAR